MILNGNINLHKLMRAPGIVTIWINTKTFPYNLNLKQLFEVKIKTCVLEFITYVEVRCMTKIAQRLRRKKIKGYCCKISIYTMCEAV